MKMRLDKILLARQLVPTREKAQALVLAGRVLVNEQKIDKPGASIACDSAIRLLGEDMPYVSRGGLKLQAALEHQRATGAISEATHRGFAPKGAGRAQGAPGQGNFWRTFDGTASSSQVGHDVLYQLTLSWRHRVTPDPLRTSQIGLLKSAIELL